MYVVDVVDSRSARFSTEYETPPAAGIIAEWHQSKVLAALADAAPEQERNKGNNGWKISLRKYDAFVNVWDNGTCNVQREALS